MKALNLILYYPVWLWVESSLWFFSFLKRVLLYWADKWAYGLTARLLFKPLYQDYTPVGIVIGPVIRCVKLSFTTFLLVFLGVSLVLPYFFFLILPLILFFPSYIESWFYIWALLIVGLTLPLYLYLKIIPPQQKLTRSSKNPLGSMAYPVRVFFDTDRTIGEFLTLIDKNKEGRRILLRAGLSRELREKLVQESFCQEKVDRGNLLLLTSREATSQGYTEIQTGHVLFALVETSPQLFEWCRQVGCDLEVIRAVTRWHQIEKDYTHPPSILSSRYKVKTNGGVNRSWCARPTPLLNVYSRDLTVAVQKRTHPPIVAKEKVTEEILAVLSRFSGANPLLLGAPGSGKSMVLMGLAEKIVDGDTPAVLRDKRVVVLDPALLLSGTRTRGEVEERMTQVIKEICEAGNIILVIEEMHTLLSSGESAELSPLLTALEPSLEDSRFHCLGTTTYENYHQFLEKNSAFSRHFHIIELPEATEEETLKLLEYEALRLEKGSHLLISYPALQAAVSLSDRLIHDRVFPDKALDVLESSLKEMPGGKDLLLLPQHVSSAVSRRLHMPLGVVSPTEAGGLLSLESSLRERLIGQDNAIKAVADILRRARIGLSDERRPLGSLLLVGPTGVGKTEIARVLAEEYFGSEDEMIRLDMSEYQTPDTVSRLTEYLTEAVRRRPRSLILLDEFEKAEKGVLDLFLQVLEDARLTSPTGFTVDFSNTLIIATSNAGAELILKTIREGHNVQEIEETLRGKLNHLFRPELLNRFDGIIFLKAFSPREVEKIVALMLMEFSLKLRNDYDINLIFDQAFVTFMAKEGYVPELGARPLRRFLKDRVESRIAHMILAGEVKRGGSIRLDASFAKVS